MKKITFLMAALICGTVAANAEENITVPAGSFKASKITYTIEANMGFTKTHLNVTEWMSKKAGVVRSETYDKKGKLQDYTVLSKFVEK